MNYSCATMQNWKITWWNLAKKISLEFWHRWKKLRDVLKLIDWRDRNHEKKFLNEFWIYSRNPDFHEKNICLEDRRKEWGKITSNFAPKTKIRKLLDLFMIFNKKDDGDSEQSSAESKSFVARPTFDLAMLSLLRRLLGFMWNLSYFTRLALCRQQQLQTTWKPFKEET